MKTRPLYIGIDVSKYKFDACAINYESEEVFVCKDYKQDLEGFAKFLGEIEGASKILKTTPIFGIESTGIYHLQLYNYLIERKYQVRIFNGLEVRAMKKNRIRKTSTDQIDAKIIAQSLRICFDKEKESPIPPELMNLKELVGARERLVRKLSVTKNQIIRNLDLLFPGFTSKFSDVLSVSCVKLLRHACTPEDIQKLTTEELCKCVQLRKALELKNLSENVQSPKYMKEALQCEIDLLLNVAECLNEQIKKVDRKIETIYSSMEHAIKSIPGIGAIVGPIIISKIGNIKKFENGMKVVAFAGLDPVIKQSGKSKIVCHISKRGDPQLRWALCMAAFVGSRCNPVLREYYKRKIAQGKPHNEAIIACAAKLCHIIHAVWRKNQKFINPNH